MTPKEKRDEFLKELKLLLLKYNAEIHLEELGSGYISDKQIVIDFAYDESQFNQGESGFTPQLLIGTWLGWEDDGE